MSDMQKQQEQLVADQVQLVADQVQLFKQEHDLWQKKNSMESVMQTDTSAALCIESPAVLNNPQLPPSSEALLPVPLFAEGADAHYAADHGQYDLFNDAMELLQQQSLVESFLSTS